MAQVIIDNFILGDDTEEYDSEQTMLRDQAEIVIDNAEGKKPASTARACNSCGGGGIEGT